MTKKTVFKASLILFLLMLPLVSKIDFYQNDDWVYYEMVGRFMTGDITLHPYTGPTFYGQGILAAVFGLIFGLNRLPILTLLVSVTNFYLLVLYMSLRMKKGTVLSILLGLLFFFNPLAIYLTLGFMTGVYFLLLLLISLWFYSYFEETRDYKYFIALIVTIYVGLVVRQVSLFIPLGLGIFYLYKKRFKPAILMLITFGSFYFYYHNIFPRSAEMEEVHLQFHHLLNTDYVYAIVYGVLVVLAAFLLPAILSSINFKQTLKDRKRVLLLVIFTYLLYSLGNQNFNPHKVSWGEFPYFENTFERTGFYPRGIHGTKYALRWNYDGYYYWDIAAKVALSFYAAYLILNRKKVINEYSIFSFVYLGLLVITETFYDRYIFILIPLVILSLSKDLIYDSVKTRVLLSLGVLFFAFYSYQLANDFVLVNKYVWDRSEELAQVKDLKKEEIHGTNAWKLHNRNSSRDYTYLFSYDSPNVNPDFRVMFKLVEEKEINFPMSIFMKPKIYLYKAQD